MPLSQRAEWQTQADVASLLGTLYGEMGQYDLAMEHLDKAMSADKAQFPVAALEQRANYRVKLALRFRQTSDKTAKDKALDDIEKAIAELSFFNNMAPTIERLSLLGSAYKRLAWLQATKAERKKALERMSEHYRHAFNLSLEKSKNQAYPLTNWITAEAILSWFDKNRDQGWQENLPAQIDEVMTKAKQKMAVNPEYWDSVVEPDCLLMMALVKGVFAAEDCNRIVEAYRLAAERGASLKDAAALREHIEFLVFMAEQAKEYELSKNLQAILRQLA